MRYLVLVLVLLAGCTGDSRVESETWVLTYASPYGPNHQFSQADQDWIDFVEREAKGRLRIRPIWSGGLISSSQSMIELRHRVADIGLITPIYAKGGAHLLSAQTAYYAGVREVAQQVALYRCLAATHAQFARELEGLKVLAVQGGSLPGILTRDVEVRSLDDVDGLRLRAPSELLPMLRELGVDAVSMPMADVYSALAKGVIDGVVAPTDSIRAMHFAEVAGYYADLVVPRGAYPARAINIETWDSLPRELRDVMDRGVEVWERAIAQRLNDAVAGSVAYAREQGMVFTSVSAEDQARFDTIYAAHVEENARSLARYGIDGVAVLRHAQASIRPDGTVDCQTSIAE